MKTIYNIINEYKKDPDPLTGDTEEMQNLKDIIYDKLTESDRRIFLLYADLQSLRKLGKTLGVSTATAFNQIKRIRQIITDNLNGIS